MRNRYVAAQGLAAALVIVTGILAWSRYATAQTAGAGGAAQPAPDAVAEAQTPRNVPANRPEQQKTEHDRSDVFGSSKAPRSSTALESQPQKGEVQGFDFYRDPLDAKRPGQSPDEIVKQDIADKPKVMDAQRRLLESRYDMRPRFDPAAKMSRGKPLAVGPTARLKGTSWEQLGQMTP